MIKKAIYTLVSFLLVAYVIETLVGVWENSKYERKNTRAAGYGLSCSHFNFSFFQISTRVSITPWKHGECFLYLFFLVNTSIQDNLVLFEQYIKFDFHGDVMLVRVNECDVL